MKKLNNKGYMLVEIVLAAVISFSVAYYLLNLTYKFKDKNEDVLYTKKMLSDKINITKNIMNDLNNRTVTSVTCIDKSVDLSTYNSDSMAQENIKLSINSNTIEYGITKEGSFKTDDNSYYVKKIEDYLEVGQITCITNNSIATIKIPLSNIYSDSVEEVKLYIKINSSQADNPSGT